MPFIKHHAFGKLIFTKTFWLLTFSDLFTWGFYLIIATLSGIYLEHKLGEDVIKVVGIGGAIYYIIRGLLQLPISKVLDKIKNDRDEIFVLTIGCVLMGLPFLFYPTLTSPNQYYVLQVIFSLGVAMNLNPWRKLFATNLEVGREAREYAVYDMVNSVFIALSIFFVGQIANISQFYFDVMMVTLGLLVMTGGLWAALITTDKNRRSADPHSEKKS
jgi:MFS-type transporter involved in bile tolerance (Atg22 family)